jgi:CO/xanthine dehydrogenase Mo-binding subunit
LDKVRPMIVDTSALGYNMLTGGSRVTFAGGIAVVGAAQDLIGTLKDRAAKFWDISVDDVEWAEGEARATNGYTDNMQPLSLQEIAKDMAKSG